MPRKVLNPPQLKVQIEGRERLRAQLERILGARESASDALMKGGEMIRDEARQRAPRRTGRLRRLIRAVRDERGDVLVGPGKLAWYGMYQEFGTRHHGAQPWLFPAYESRKKDVESLLAGVVAKELRTRSTEV